MKSSWQIVTLLMAVSLVILSIKVSVQSDSAEAELTSMDISEIVYNNIMTRSSVRKYSSQPVEAEKIEKLLRAGMAAPTGGNKQPWEFVVITDREVLAQFPPLVKGAHMADKAPLAIAVLGSPSKALLPEYWVQDCCAATENILLAAHGMGLGAVWCGVYPENNTGRFEAVNRVLNLPEGLYTLNILVIGYPVEEPVVKDKWDPAKVHYNRY